MTPPPPLPQYIAGKGAMKSSPGTFSASASSAYKLLGEADKNSLLQQAVEREGSVTSVEVRKAAAKIFKRIQSQVSYYVYQL